MAIPARICLSLTAALLMTACGSLAGDPRHLHPPCTPGVCFATVTVLSCEGGALPVTPDPIVVDAPKNIEWTIVTPGYKFPTNGIVVNGRGFSNAHATPNGKKFIVHDDPAIDRRLDIKYEVRVIREADNFECKPYDPYISNQ